MDFSQLNWLAIAVATVLAFGLGAIWYGPMFGKTWQQMMKLSDEELQQGHPGLIFGPAFVLTFVQATALAALMPAGSELLSGALFGAAVAAALIGSGLGVNYLFSRHPRGLWGIDAGFNVVQGLIMGAVLGAWA